MFKKGAGVYFNIAYSNSKPGSIFPVYLNRIWYVPLIVAVFPHQNNALQKKRN